MEPSNNPQPTANHLSQLLCLGNNQPSLTCLQQDCTAHPLMCGDDRCICYAPHRNHLIRQPYQRFVESISQSQQVPREL